MDIDDDDDFYSPEEPTIANNDNEKHDRDGGEQAVKPIVDDELEEGEEQDEGGGGSEEDEDDDDEDSDIDIILERKDGSKPTPAPVLVTRYNEIRNIPQRSASTEAVPKAVSAATGTKRESLTPRPSAVYPTAVPTADQEAAAASSSKMDINANPIYPPAGKPITQVNIDEDLGDNEKPWRKPGTDITDYFNYGFDEFTWALYAAKQENIRAEYDPDTVGASQKKMMEDFMMMMGSGMPGGPGGASGGPQAAAGPGPGMPGMEAISPEMQAVMQQMMAGGGAMDMSQMDPSMAAMFGGMQGGAGGDGGGGMQGQQGFPQGFGGQGYGQNFDGGIGGGRINRGRGGRRW